MFFKKNKLLKPGDKAPDFSVSDHQGNTVSSADLAGQRYLLWWYPKADTPGCTIEGCGFRDRIQETTEVGPIFGVSFDTPADNKAFAEKFGFPYPLLCDTSKAMSVAWGAARNASADHPDRVTYIVDADGLIEYAEKVGDIEAHIEAAIAHFKDV